MKKKMLAERSKTRGKPSDRYPLFVSWSDKDQAFIGYCPVLFVGGVCHDENRKTAYAKLVEIVEEDIQSRLEKARFHQNQKMTFGLLRVPRLKRGRKRLNDDACAGSQTSRSGCRYSGTGQIGTKSTSPSPTA